MRWWLFAIVVVLGVGVTAGIRYAQSSAGAVSASRTVRWVVTAPNIQRLRCDSVATLRDDLRRQLERDGWSLQRDSPPTTPLIYHRETNLGIIVLHETTVVRGSDRHVGVTVRWCVIWGCATTGRC
jgi:hypothetical protein